MADPVTDFEHDHVAFSQAVDELESLLGHRARDQVADLRILQLAEKLRDEVLAHFAKEEEALFPFLSRALPDVGLEVDELLVAHDTVCGSLLRFAHYLGKGMVDRELTFALFERFERAYREHARAEVAFLRRVGARLDSSQRRELAALVRGL